MAHLHRGITGLRHGTSSVSSEAFPMIAQGHIHPQEDPRGYAGEVETSDVCGDSRDEGFDDTYGREA